MSNSLGVLEVKDDAIMLVGALLRTTPEYGRA